MRSTACHSSYYYVMFVFKEKEGDLEVDSASTLASGDAHIIDVTNEFSGCQGVVDITSEDDSSTAECPSASPHPVASSPDTADAQQADTGVQQLSEAVADVCVQDDLVPAGAASPAELDVALVLGGMDTAGELFDDCLVFCLSAL